MVLVKKLKIYLLSCFGKLSQENVFGYILERKKAFLDYKKGVQKVEKLGFFQRS